MRHPGVMKVALTLGLVACADGTTLDDGGGGTAATGTWSGSGGGTTTATTSGAGAGGAGNTTTTSSSGGGGGQGGSTTSTTTSAGGSGSGGGDVTPPTVVDVTPGDGTMAVLSSSKVSVTFSEPMAPASVTASANASCSGSIQLSKDDFLSCVPIVGGAVTEDDLTFTLTPTAALASLGTYKVRVTTGATDAAGNGLAQAFESNGFATAFRHTVVMDGVNDFFPMSDAFATSTAGNQLYVTHDETDLFVGLSSPDIAPGSAGNKFVYFLFSVDGALASGNTLSSDGKAKFGAGKAMTFHYKERIAGGTYKEYRVGDTSGWTADWGTQNKSSFVATGFLEAQIALSELGASPSSVSVTAFTIDYAGDAGSGWLYNMFTGATDGSGAAPRDLVKYVGLTLPASAAPNDATHLKSF